MLLFHFALSLTLPFEAPKTCAKLPNLQNASVGRKNCWEKAGRRPTVRRHSYGCTYTRAGRRVTKFTTKIRGQLVHVWGFIILPVLYKIEFESRIIISNLKSCIDSLRQASLHSTIEHPPKRLINSRMILLGTLLTRLK